MVKCDYCDNELDYLPFKCRYCGKQFCKSHRLPENHECSFEYKNDPYFVKNITPRSINTSSNYVQEPMYSADYTDTQDQRNQPPRTNLFNPFGSQRTQLKATYGLMIAQVIFFVLTLIPNFENYVYLSASNLIYPWTILTSIFAPNGIFDVIFNLLILYFIGRIIETRYGWKTFLWIYCVSGLITAGMFVLLEFLFSLIPVFGSNMLQVEGGLTSGAMLGPIAFMTLLLPDTEMRILLFFIPVKIRTRRLLLYFLGFYVFFGILDLIFYFSSMDVLYLTFVFDFACIFGALGGYLRLKAIQEGRI